MPISTPLPTPYVRQASFTDWEANHPGEPNPGTDLDAELNAVYVSMLTTQDRLQLIQNDDGTLANASVGPEQLAQGLLDFTSGGWFPRGAWQTDTTYAVRDAVNMGGIVWVAVLAHVSTGDFAADAASGKWMFINQPMAAVAIPVTAIPNIAALNVQGVLDILAARQWGLPLDLADTVNPLKGISYIPTASRQVNTIATLRTLPKVGGSVVAKVQGYYARGDGGGGTYWLDTADTTSVDNGGNIVVAADGGRWKLITTKPLSIKQFGAKGDGAANDTAAIQMAAAAIGYTGLLRAPKGIYNHTILTFDSAIGLTIQGDGAIGATIFRCTSTNATDGIKLRSTFDCTLSLITFDHISASFTGWLIDTRHKAGSTTDTQGLKLDRCTFTSEGYNKYTAKGLNLDQSTLITVDGCKFVALLRGIDGQNPAGGGYSNGVRILNGQFADISGYALNFLGEQWTVQDTNFQASHDGSSKIVYSDSTTAWRNLVFINSSVYDALALGPAMLNLGTGSGLFVVGGMWGGRGDLGSSTWLSATGVVTNVNACSTFSMFTNIAVAGVAGCLGWNISNGNKFIPITAQPISATTMLTPRANAPDARFDNNVPNVSLRDGTGPATNWRTYNPDGTMWIGGIIASAGAAATGTLSYPLGAASYTLDVQLTLQSPATTSNVVSLVGSPTGASFQYYINGTGTSTVRWRALVA